jgi:hypothetical protein
MAVIESLDKAIFGTRAVEFTSDYPLEESVERLAGIVKESVFCAFTKQKLVGEVSSDLVYFRRVMPFFEILTFKPYFTGAFHIKEGKVVLSGNFSIHWSARIFLVLWSGLCILWTYIGIGEYSSNKFESIFISIFFVFMLLGGFVVVRFGQWFYRGDKVWISKRISEALSHGVVEK